MAINIHALSRGSASTQLKPRPVMNLLTGNSQSDTTSIVMIMAVSKGRVLHLQIYIYERRKGSQCWKQSSHSENKDSWSCWSIQKHPPSPSTLKDKSSQSLTHIRCHTHKHTHTLLYFLHSHCLPTALTADVAPDTFPRSVCLFPLVSQRPDPPRNTFLHPTSCWCRISRWMFVFFRGSDSRLLVYISLPPTRHPRLFFLVRRLCSTQDQCQKKGYENGREAQTTQLDRRQKCKTWLPIKPEGWRETRVIWWHTAA